MVSLSQAAASEVEQAVRMRAKFESLTDSLRSNPYKRPLHVESTEAESNLMGDVYAVVPHQFAAVSAALTQAAPWCDILILPLTTKGCRVTAGSGSGPKLDLRIGLNTEQALEEAFPLEFTFRVQANLPQYFTTRLDADNGPLGTRDYRILVEAVPLEAGKTFLHLHYAYGFGTAGRLAMQAYLATFGANKVGFTSSGGKLTGGTRGVIERNSMRFQLAIDAYLGTASFPAAEQVDRRLGAWFDSTDQYVRQLREMDREAYMAMKRREIQRQRQDVVWAQPVSGRF